MYCVPEILVLGCGKRIGRVSKELRDFLHSNGIKIEAIDTVHDFIALLFFLFEVSTTLHICIEHFLLPSISALCTLNNIFVKQALECDRHVNYSSGCGLDPLLATTMHFFVIQNKAHFWLKNRLTSIINPRIGAICGVETDNLWILRVIASYKFTCMLWSSLVPHGNYKQNRTEESKQQPLQDTPNYTCIIVGQAIVVVVVVVINAPFPSLSPKIRTKEIES